MLKKLINQYLIRSPQELDFMRAFKFLRVNKIHGTYVEFGVASGKSMVMAHELAKQSNYEFERFWGFDSFEGLPEPKGKDKNFNWQKGQYAYTIEQVENKLITAGMFNCPLIKGYYEDTLKTFYGIGPIAFVHIDCDYYESTVLVLDFIKRYMQDGMIIMFNDWYCFNGRSDHGEQKAFNEFKSKNKHIKFTELPCQDIIKAFYINLRR